MLAELIKEAGLPDGMLQVVNGDKEAVDAILDNPTIAAIGFVGSTPIAEYIYGARLCKRQARAVLWRRQEPHDHHARRRSGSGGRCADRCRLRRGGRTLHGDFGRRPGGRRNRRPLIAKLIPRIEKLKVGPYTAGNDVDYGPVVTAAAKANILRLVETGVAQGAKLVVDGRGFKTAGL